MGGIKPFSSSKPARKKELFTGKSLPQAGESLRDRAIDLLFGRALVLSITGVMGVVFGLTDIVIRWAGFEPNPWPWVVLGGLLLLVGLWDFRRIWPQLRNLRLGIRGEQEVGRLLEETRRLGYQVFHDLPGDGFNVDHALIGPGGVFAIETKAVSKRPSRDAKVDYDGTRVLIDGHTPDRDPIAQARASADHLHDLLKRTTGRDVYVRPVVLYPGWYVENRARSPAVWVLNPKGMVPWLRNEPAKLSGEDVALYVDRVTRHLSDE